MSYLSQKNNQVNELDIHPMIEKRVYRVKNPGINFYCPLCRMERQVFYRPRLSSLNYLQITMVSFVLITLTYSTMEIYALVWPFTVLACFEAARRLLFKREVPCPHCGFDATWYKRDVKIARQKVSDFWQKRNVPAPSSEKTSVSNA